MRLLIPLVLICITILVTMIIWISENGFYITLTLHIAVTILIWSTGIAGVIAYRYLIRE